MACYVFGYGSLICASSRALTGITGEAVPCIYKGLKRYWSIPIPSIKAIALEVFQDDASLCNGVLVQIQDSELPKFDEREIGYKRIKLNFERFRFGKQGAKESGDIWVYVSASDPKIDSDYHILQSYVDVILTGCLEYGESFAKDFVSTTYGWNAPWIFDREKPLYPRALKENIYKEKIDTLLQKYIDR